MGVFSWTCPHCDHSILAQADSSINEWMLEAVVLEPCGDRVSGSYDGYGGVGDTEIADAMESGAVLVHLACWEASGKPDFGFYADKGLVSKSALDQGYFYSDGDHDLIDPRITDSAERERLLIEGRRARDVARYGAKAQLVGEILHEAKDLEPEDRWKARFGVWEPHGHSKTYALTDKLGGLAATDLSDHTAAEELARRLWGQWIETDEFKSLLAHAKELHLAARAQVLEDLKVKGRYSVAYHPIAGGDIVKKSGERDWVGGRTVYAVSDALNFGDVAVMDAPWVALGTKTFESDPEYAGNNSPAWEARVELIRAAQRESRDLAQAEVDRLNKEWAENGYPVEGTWLDPSRAADFEV